MSLFSGGFLSSKPDATAHATADEPSATVMQSQFVETAPDGMVAVAESTESDRGEQPSGFDGGFAPASLASELISEFAAGTPHDGPGETAPPAAAMDLNLAEESGLASLLRDVGLNSDGSKADAAMTPHEDTEVDDGKKFHPRAPKSLRQTGLPRDLVESLVLKFLLNRGAASGREIHEQICLPFRVVDDFLRELKTEQLIGHRCSSGTNDYIWEMTVEGFERARRQSEVTTYFGAAPVTLKTYVDSVERQALKSQMPTPDDLDAALADLTLPEKMMQQIGQAVRAAKAMFLFGSPGNGKTSIAQRISASYGEDIWMPRSLYIDGEIVRLFDPVMHEVLPIPQGAEVDHRWVRIKRPTIIAGGELTLDNLEMTTVGETRVVEAPLQLKSNCGILVIDDFGRQRCSATDLLNRWIVPLETQFDFLNMPSGKKVRVPFEQMVVFSTNLAPQQLVDEAFLRRIPYKVEAVDPSEPEFRRVFKILAEKMKVGYCDESFDRMIKRHYLPHDRGLRYCHARDLLSQIKTMCDYEGLPAVMTDDTIDRAVENYFVSYGDDQDFGACANV